MAIFATLAAACSKDAPNEQPATMPIAVATGKPDSAAPAGSHSSLVASDWLPALPPRPPGLPKDCNVILLSIDSLRADMPWNGYARAIAPRQIGRAHV